MDNAQEDTPVLVKRSNNDLETPSTEDRVQPSLTSTEATIPSSSKLQNQEWITRSRSPSPTKRKRRYSSPHTNEHDTHIRRNSRSRSRSPLRTNLQDIVHTSRDKNDLVIDLTTTNDDTTTQTSHHFEGGDATTIPTIPPTSSSPSPPLLIPPLHTLSPSHRRVIHETTLISLPSPPPPSPLPPPPSLLVTSAPFQDAILSSRVAPTSFFVPVAGDASIVAHGSFPFTHSTAPRLIYGTARAQGLRPYMEDRHTVIPEFNPKMGSSTARDNSMAHDGNAAENSPNFPYKDDVRHSFAAVYDGHNGTMAADYAAVRLHHLLADEPALKTCTGSGCPPAIALLEEEKISAAFVRAFEITDNEILTRCRTENSRGGATAVTILLLGETLYAAHCGDSRAVMCRRGEPLRLTEDHKPNLPRERKRVEGLGGRVDFARCWRVIVDPGNGRPASGLAVSRSFGDPDFKEPSKLVTATPDVMMERVMPGDSFVILASDGLWDVLSDKEACDIVRASLESTESALKDEVVIEKENRRDSLAATVAAEALVKASLDAGTMDNVTAVIGVFAWS